VVTADLSFSRMAKMLSEIEHPYPNAYYVLLGGDGRYLIHPDTTRLFKKTIFTDASPTEDMDLITLGYEMTAGKQGSVHVHTDGKLYHVAYMPVPATDWSLALVCPDIDAMKSYYSLGYVIIALLVAGLLVILILCRRAAAHAITPIHQLLRKTKSIARGDIEVHIPYSSRIDAVGCLQNSFATMLQSLNFNMGSVRFTSEETQRKNEELVEATRLAEESDRQKTAFIQNVTHQIRTPLNIIMGFAQVLRDMGDNNNVSDDEMKSVTSTLDHNAKLLYRLVSMLFDSSETGQAEELNSERLDHVSCNEVARESLSYLKTHYPNVKTQLQSELADDFMLQTNHLYLMRCLREVLYNAAKYSDGEHVELHILRHDQTIRFVIQDTGTGIAEADRELMFKFFTKVDDLSEGLGLGLPLAKRHAQNLGGDLKLDESYRDGCRFIIDIPFN
jgi:signal transduction histidine kinase